MHIYKKAITVMLSLTKHDVFTNMMSPFVKLRVTFPRITKGLLASWDYAATSLLNSQGGSGGGVRSKNEPALMDECVISYIDDPNDVYDSRKFSTNDRKNISVIINNELTFKLSQFKPPLVVFKKTENPFVSAPPA